MASPVVKKRRVAQWATGNVGSRALRRVIEHPDLELVGVWVSSEAKAGRDAGELCGLPPTGIRATRSIEEIVAARPDCVLYMPHVMNVDEVCRLLESGSNIVTTLPLFQNPALLDAATRERVEQACQRGRTSIHGTGSSPGFITEALPLVLASIQRRLDCITIYEYAPCQSRNSPEMLFEVMGFGQRGEAGPNQAIMQHMTATFSGTLALIADAVGLTADEVTTQGALGITRRDEVIAAGTVPAGTIGATRTTIAAKRQGKPVMQMVATWFVATDVDTSDGEDWHFRESGWRVIVEGDCPLDISITFPVAPEHYAEMTPGLTAHRPVNAIPYVCDAAPGIRTTVDLPHVVARFS